MFCNLEFCGKSIGAVKTSVYIYMVPVITVVTSVIILHETITVMAGVGTILTLAGLFLSESKAFARKEDKEYRGWGVCFLCLRNSAHAPVFPCQ